MKPEAAIPRLTRAIVLADALGARWVNTDEMLKPDWLDDDFAHEVMRYTLTRADQVARRHGVDICVEPHGVYTKTAAGLRRIVELVPSERIGVNWDTGNSLPGRPGGSVRGARVGQDLVRHVHAKDISMEHAERERGVVTGTPVGCACGDGVVDWERVLHILARPRPRAQRRVRHDRGGRALSHVPAHARVTSWRGATAAKLGRSGDRSPTCGGGRASARA